MKNSYAAAPCLGAASARHAAHLPLSHLRAGTSTSRYVPKEKTITAAVPTTNQIARAVSGSSPSLLPSDSVTGKSSRTTEKWV
jgi:hypothetical protein